MDILDPFPPEIRIKFVELEDGNPVEHGFSMPADATPEQIEAAKQVSRETSARIGAFRVLPEVDRLKYYLAIASDALLKIMNETYIDLRQEDWIDIPSRYRTMISSASCTADMAIIEIPYKYRKTEITI